mgnify:CR=1 FL=1
MALRLDKFKLITYQNIDLDERNVITLLYQPLIGCKAFALYNTLWAMIDRSRLKSPEYMHTKLFDLLSVTPEEFTKARKTLEAIGLLSVYQGEDLYLYEVKAPVTAAEFIKDGALGAYLYKKIGKAEFDDISSLFRISNVEKNGFKNITTHFDEVFDSLPNAIESQDNYVSRSKSKITINHDFDFDIFIEGLSKNYVDRRKITSKIKEKIINLSYIYSLDEITMQKVFMDSVDEDRNVDTSELSKSAKYWHSVLATSKAIPSETDYEEIMITPTNVKQMCKKYPPIDLIAIATGHKPSKTESNTIEQVLENMEYPKEILNFLLLYCMQQSNNNNKVPHFNFIETVYVSWKRENVKTFEDAINTTIKYAENKNKKSNTKLNTKKSTTKEFEPDWLEDYMKEF